jgi:2-methylcitrate dehydratase PrpD
MLGELGNVWHIKNAEIKPYASSRGSHRHIEVFSRILQEQNIDLSDIDEVVVVADVVSRSPIFLNTDVRDSDAFMSWAYVLGAAALYPTGADWYSKRALEDPRIKEFVPKVVVRDDPVKGDERASSPGADSRHASVVVRTGTNSFSVELPDFARGHPSRPLSAGEVDEKFLRNASEQMPPEAATRVLAQLRTILEADDLGELYASLGGVPT